MRAIQKMAFAATKKVFPSGFTPSLSSPDSLGARCQPYPASLRGINLLIGPRGFEGALDGFLAFDVGESFTYGNLRGLVKVTSAPWPLRLMKMEMPTLVLGHRNV